MGKVYHLNDLEEFYCSDEWKLTIDLTDIWNKVSKNEITYEQFNQDYSKILIQYKDQIAKLNTEAWNSLVPLINELNTKKTKEDSFDLYEKIYDVCDKNDIQLKTK